MSLAAIATYRINAVPTSIEPRLEPNIRVTAAARAEVDLRHAHTGCNLHRGRVVSTRVHYEERDEKCIAFDKGGQKVFFWTTSPQLATQNFLASDPPHPPLPPTGPVLYSQTPQCIFYFNWFFAAVFVYFNRF